MQRSVSILPLLLAVSLSGCRAPEGVVATPHVRITPEIRSRVTGLHFDEGDRIGLRILRGAEPFAENHEMVYDGTAFTASDLLWYDDPREKSVLQAYYPYDAAGMPEEFSVAADQSAGTASSDLLAAVAHNVLPGAAPVRMLFRHLMAQLDVLVDNRSGSAVTSVSLDGFRTVAEVDFATPSARAGEGAAAGSVRTQEVEAGRRYRAVLVPQEGELAVTVTTADGRSRTESIAAARLDGGKRYDLSVTVDKTEIRVSLGGEIEDWEEGGTLGGDDTPGGGETLEYEGERYRTAVIGGLRWMVENLRHMPAGATLTQGVWYPRGEAGSDGGDPTAVPVHGLLYDYATATGGAATRTGAPLRGICPEGWHLPSKEELATLTGIGTELFSRAGYMVVGSGGMPNRYGENYEGYLMSTTLTEGRCECLLFDDTEGVRMHMVRKENGISVRCVADS